MMYRTIELDLVGRQPVSIDNVTRTSYVPYKLRTVKVYCCYSRGSRLPVVEQDFVKGYDLTLIYIGSIGVA